MVFHFSAVPGPVLVTTGLLVMVVDAECVQGGWYEAGPLLCGRMSDKGSYVLMQGAANVQ